MEVLLHALNGVMTILIMIATGVYIDRKGWCDEKSMSMISKIVTQVCLPTFMISSITKNFQYEQLISLSKGVVVPFTTMLLGYLISKVIARMAGVSKEHRGIFTACVSFSNTIFIGLPLCLALFGEEGTPYVMIYYMVNTALFWTIGVYELAADTGENVSLFSKRTLKNVVSPPLLGFIIGIAMVLVGLKLPAPVFRAFQYVGSMTTPLAMLFIGAAMSRTDWNSIRVGKEMVVAMLSRYFVCPVLVILITPFFHLPVLMGKIFVVMSAMPAMTNAAIVTEAYGGDYKYAAMLTAVSTVLAIFVVPLYMIILS